MLKGAIHRRWFVQPSHTILSQSFKPISAVPYRSHKNSVPPIKSTVTPPVPSLQEEIQEKINLDKAKLKEDILALQKSQTFSWSDFKELTKFKLSGLNTWVAATGYFMTNKCVYSDLTSVGMFLLAAQMSAMSSQAMNQAIEVEHDKKMKRTCHRPLPLGKFTKSQATSISWGLLGASNVILYSMFGWQAGMMANAIFSSYILIYTPMKRTSEANTIWGSVVGAAVPYLGWFAGGGSAMSMTPLLTCLFLFAWQFPHFYGILWTYKDDYRKGGYKMLEDPAIAARHAKLAVAGYLAATIGLIATGDISIYSSIPASYAYWKYGWKAAREFEMNPTVENAKKMKYGSYWPFTIFFLAVIAGIVQRVYIHEYHLKYVKEEQEVKKEEETIENKAQPANTQL